MSFSKIRNGLLRHGAARFPFRYLLLLNFLAANSFNGENCFTETEAGLIPCSCVQYCGLKSPYRHPASFFPEQLFVRHLSMLCR